MTAHIHHVPGRLRLRTPRLKRDRQRAEAVRDALRRLPAVTSAEANPLTGSVTVHYDRARGDLAALAEVLRQHACLTSALPAPSISAPAARPVAAGDSASGSRVLHTVARTAAVYLLEQAVERSVVLLLTSLL